MDKAKIHTLLIENIKKISAAAIVMDGEDYVITGDVDQGKTTLVETCAMAIRGADPDVISWGKDTGVITLHLTDGKRIERTIERLKKSKVKVSGPDGELATKSATAFLKALSGGGEIFSPLAFVDLSRIKGAGETKARRDLCEKVLAAIPCEMYRDEVLAAINQLSGEEYEAAFNAVEPNKFDYSARHPMSTLELLHKVVFEARAEKNIEVKTAAAVANASERPTRATPGRSLEDLEHVTRGLEQALENARHANSLCDQTQGRLDTVQGRIGERKEDPAFPDESMSDLQKGLKEAVDLSNDLEVQMEELRERYGNAEIEAENFSAKIRALGEQQEDIAQAAKISAEITSARVDIEPLEDNVAFAKEDVANQKKQAVIEAAEEKFEAAKAKAEILTAIADVLKNTLPQQIIARMDMPVEGLGIADGELTYLGKPVASYGTEKRTFVGVMLAAALNDLCGFTVVDGAESLGNAGKKGLHDAAKERGVQLIMTKVDADAEPGPGQGVMKDGVLIQQ